MMSLITRSLSPSSSVLEDRPADDGRKLELGEVLRGIADLEEASSAVKDFMGVEKFVSFCRPAKQESRAEYVPIGGGMPCVCLGPQNKEERLRRG